MERYIKEECFFKAPDTALYVNSELDPALAPDPCFAVTTNIKFLQIFNLLFSVFSILQTNAKFTLVTGFYNVGTYVGTKACLKSRYQDQCKKTEKDFSLTSF